MSYICVATAQFLSSSAGRSTKASMAETWCPRLRQVDVESSSRKCQVVTRWVHLVGCFEITDGNASTALNMLLRAKEEGKITEKTDTIIEYSSGSTVISLGILANILGIEHVKAYLSNKTSPAKLDLLRFFVGPLLFEQAGIFTIGGIL